MTVATRFALVDKERLVPMSPDALLRHQLDAVVRDMWPDEALDQHHRGVRFVGTPGPPWVLIRPHCDDYTLTAIYPDERLSGKSLITAINLDIEGALGTMRAKAVSVSEALVAGERRRLRAS